MLIDEDPMPYGKYEGMPMKDVPADYLFWIYKEQVVNKEVEQYIEDNWDCLEQEQE